MLYEVCKCKEKNKAFLHGCHGQNDNETWYKSNYDEEIQLNKSSIICTEYIIVKNIVIQIVCM